jgi:hypothetical protein
MRATRNEDGRTGMEGGGEAGKDAASTKQAEWWLGRAGGGREGSPHQEEDEDEQ